MDFITRMAAAFADESNKIKQASILKHPKLLSVGAPMVAGGLLTLGGLQAKQDYQLGRQIRLQQGNQGY